MNRWFLILMLLVAPAWAGPVFVNLEHNAGYETGIVTSVHRYKCGYEYTHNSLGVPLTAAPTIPYYLGRRGNYTLGGGVTALELSPITDGHSLTYNSDGYAAGQIMNLDGSNQRGALWGVQGACWPVGGRIVRDYKDGIGVGQSTEGYGAIWYGKFDMHIPFPNVSDFLTVQNGVAAGHLYNHPATYDTQTGAASVLSYGTGAVTAGNGTQWVGNVGAEWGYWDAADAWQAMEGWTGITDIADDGTIVGMTDAGPAIYWQGETQLFEEWFLERGGVLPGSGGEFLSLTSVSEDTRLFAGQWLGDDGYNGFIVEVPEPGSLALLLLGAVVVRRRRWPSLVWRQTDTGAANY